MNVVEFLRGVSLFAGLSEEELTPIQSRVDDLKFVRDAFICKEGEKADSMFVIKSGIVQIFCDDGRSGRKILTHLKLGEYFGEMSLLTEEPRTASAIALAETEILRIKKEDFYALLKSSTAIALTIIKTLCDRLAKANVGSSGDKKYNIYAVMGPDTSSGKSLFSRNLAMAMHKILGKPVLLFDPNLRDDRVARMLGVEAHSRIIDELVDRERISEINKYVVTAPCGLLTLLPQENGLTDLRLKEFHTFSLLKTIMESFEFIVVDSSSMFTKVTKELVQACDKIVYLISSKNVSIGGLIDHFEETRRTWHVEPSKVVYGVNHLTDDPTKESIISDKDRTYLRFQLPFEKPLAGRREPDTQTLVQRDPENTISKIANMQAEDLLFDQVIGLYLPAFNDDPAKASLARRWAETGVSELAAILRQISLKENVSKDGKPCFHLEGRAPRWALNKQVPMVVDFASRFKQEFAIDKMILSLNGQDSVI
ncbi:MAG: cyclic nucleotide-binding domain-containing protein [Candidatus Riflebacteria bacterium]|nr:cyclic nucleotide-binding domain-containing protein [Candidatus Riflebacteria bacterium]